MKHTLLICSTSVERNDGSVFINLDGGQTNGGTTLAFSEAHAKLLAEAIMKSFSCAWCGDEACSTGKWDGVTSTPCPPDCCHKHDPATCSTKKRAVRKSFGREIE